MAPCRVLALLLLGALAGCGVGANDYRAAVRDVQARHETRLTDLTAKATADLSGHPDAAAIDLEALAKEIVSFANDVRDVPAPEEDHAAATTLVAAYGRLGEATAALRVAVLARDRTMLAAALATFNAAANGEAAAVDAFNGT